MIADPRKRRLVLGALLLAVMSAVMLPIYDIVTRMKI